MRSILFLIFMICLLILAFVFIFHLAKAFDSPIELEVPAAKAQEIKQSLLEKSPTAMVETEYGFFFNVLGVRVKVYD